MEQQSGNSKKFDTGGRHARAILIVCSLLYMVNYMDRQVLSAVLEPMKLELGFSDTQAGMLQTAFFISMALLALPISYFIDRWSRRKSIAIMAIVWSAFTYVTGLGRDFISVLASRFLVAVGEAGFSAGGTAMITAAYPRESRGRALGVFNIPIPLGAALGVMLGGYISTNYGGWRTPFFVFAIPGVLLGITAFFLRDYKTVSVGGESGTLKGFLDGALELLKTPSLKWALVGYGMHNVYAFTILAWMPALLMRSLQVSEARAGMMMGLIAMCAIVGALLGGILADSWQKRNPRGRMLLPIIADVGAAFAMVFMVLTLMTGAPAALFYSVGILYGIGSVLGMPALGAVTQDVVHPGLKGMSWGLAMFCMYVLGGGWAPVLVGILSDAMGGGAEGLQWATMLMASGGILSGLCYWRGARYYPADAERVRNIILETEE